MPKTKISEFDSVAANNTDIDGINLGEGMLPSDVNNAIRELMAQIKELQAGTSGDTIPIAAGGTGSTTNTAARTALGATTTGNSLFTAVDAAAARTTLGATTVGSNVFTLTNPSAITFPRFNANNTVSALSAADFRTAIGAGTGDVTLSGTQTLTNKTIGMAGALDCNNNVIQEIKTATFNSQTTIATTSGAITVNWTTAQNQLQTEPTGTITYTFTAPPGPCHLQLIINSDGTSTAQTINFPGTVTFMGATFAGANNKKSVINFWYDGTNYLALSTNQA